MPYMTQYNLVWSHQQPSRDQVAAFMAGLNNPEPQALNTDQQDIKHWKGVLDGETETDWYNHQEDLALLSRDWPQVLFTLKGYGENREDTWIEYHLGGLCQREEARLVYPEFKPTQLRQPG